MVRLQPEQYYTVKEHKPDFHSVADLYRLRPNPRAALYRRPIVAMSSVNSSTIVFVSVGRVSDSAAM